MSVCVAVDRVWFSLFRVQFGSPLVLFLVLVLVCLPHANCFMLCMSGLWVQVHYPSL